MNHRRPLLDLRAVPAAWSPEPSCAAVLNAGGALAPAIEPHVNQVLAEAMRRLGPEHGALKAQIRILVRQESEHVRLHDAFNQALYAQGFGRLEAVVGDLRRELADQARRRSFAFNLAWCVGFETFTLYLGQFLFGPGARWLQGGEPRAVALWRWHLAEEHEHRGVCHDAYRALVGDYPLRLRAMAHAHRQVGRYRRKALDVLTRERRQPFARALAADVAPRLLPALLPFYDPARVTARPGMAEALEALPDIAAARHAP